MSHTRAHSHIKCVIICFLPVYFSYSYIPWYVPRTSFSFTLIIIIICIDLFAASSAFVYKMKSILIAYRYNCIGVYFCPVFWPYSYAYAFRFCIAFSYNKILNEPSQPLCYDFDAVSSLPTTPLRHTPCSPNLTRKPKRFLPPTSFSYIYSNNLHWLICCLVCFCIQNEIHTYCLDIIVLSSTFV